MKDISIDIETLGTQASSVVLSIGACYFDRHSGEIGKKFYAVLETETQQQCGRTIDQSTVEWWYKQPREAFEEAYSNPNRFNTRPVLRDLHKFIANDGARDCKLWGNGSDFDNAIVANLFQSYKCKRLPWEFWNNRCMRTFKSEFKGAYTPPKFEGTPHNALHDAVHQAKTLQAIFKTLALTLSYS